MVVIAPIPIAWFTDKLSKEACETMGIRVIPVKSWITLTHLITQVPLPEDFRLSEYVRSDKFHAVFFDYQGVNDVLIHPDEVQRHAKKAIRKTARRGRVHIRKILEKL